MNSKIAFLLILVLNTTMSWGQYVLETPDGKKVQLNPNGTWTFIKSDSKQNSKSSVPASSTAEYLSRYRNFSVWYDPTKWVVDTVRKTTGFTWDAYFYSEDFALQGYCLDSRLSMPPESIEAQIREQWQSTGEIISFQTIKDTVNKLPITIYEMEYSQNNLNYIYKGIIYSGPKGSFQLTIGTQKHIFREDKSKIEILFRGLTKKVNS